MHTTRHTRAGRNRRVIVAGAPLIAAAGIAVVAPSGATAIQLPGSDFEIDDDANLVLDAGNPGSIDWATVDDDRKADAPSGQTDDSFGNGTKEDTAVPSVIDGSIPNNKSDLLNFGAYLETTPGGEHFLNIFWHRVQEPTGTTNMDFEFNQSSMISANGVTPVYIVRLDSVKVGDITLNNIQGAVHANGMPVVLLGMSFLGQLEMRNDGSALSLTKRF